MRLARPARAGRSRWAGAEGRVCCASAGPLECVAHRVPPRPLSPSGPPWIDAVPTAPRRASHLPRSGPPAPPSEEVRHRRRGSQGFSFAEPSGLPRARPVSRERRLDRFCLRRVPREHDLRVLHARRAPGRHRHGRPGAPSDERRGRRCRRPRTQDRALADRPASRALASFPPVPRSASRAVGDGSETVEHSIVVTGCPGAAETARNGARADVR